MSAHIVFLFNLLQDVGVARPLVHLAAAEFSDSIGFLVSTAFLKRDREGIWIAELSRMSRELGATIQVYDTPWAAYRHLQGKHGTLVAASESNLKAHSHTHELFRIAPSGFVRVTLQHGYECVGFLHNREQSQVHGANVRFAADVICGWADERRLTSLAPSERPKLYVTGPTLAMAARPASRDPDHPGGGLVCENLHSVRFSTASGRRVLFVEQFVAFAAVIGYRGQPLALRPHPGGQYVLRNGVALPENVRLENRPLYRLDLPAFAFGISAPSTILIDMMIAGLPVAVWNDPEAGIDAGNYAGLHMIRSIDDWLRFEDEATREPDAFRARQAAFLDASGMLLDPREAQTRFARLLAGAGAGPAAQIMTRPIRILLFANAIIPSFTISFLHPLQALLDTGRVEIVVVTEGDFNTGFGDPAGDEAGDWLEEEIAGWRPDIIAACRYSGPHAARIVAAARAHDIPLVYHLDDDLLGIPPEIGASKYRHHNAPARIASVTTLLDGATLVYASTAPLRDAVAARGLDAPVTSGAIYCADEVRRPPARRLRGTFGYMGGRDHGPDLATIVPAIAAVLDRHPALRFEIFGGLPIPEGLLRFGDRIGLIPPVEGYDAFRAAFEAVEWDVGLCPLVPSPFNACKADTKWVDYTAIGIAVIASAGLGYDGACADGCGVLAGNEAEWAAAIETLCTDEQGRYAQVLAAQAKLARDYTPARLTAQLLDIFAAAGLDTALLSAEGDQIAAIGA